jgi:uncharacterized Fe-S cluster-containing protein
MTCEAHASLLYTKIRTLRSFLTHSRSHVRSPKLDKARKQEFAKADVETRKKFKKKRFLILKCGKKLDEKKRETLTVLMTKNKRLYPAYLLKEQALDIFEERGEETALQ